MIVFDTLSIDYNPRLESYTVSNDYVYISTDTDCKLWIEPGKYTPRLCVTAIAHDGSVATMIYTHDIVSKGCVYQ